MKEKEISKEMFHFQEHSPLELTIGLNLNSVSSSLLAKQITVPPIRELLDMSDTHSSTGSLSTQATHGPCPTGVGVSSNTYSMMHPLTPSLRRADHLQKESPSFFQLMEVHTDHSLLVHCLSCSPVI